jgi:hypothetical protein
MREKQYIYFAIIFKILWNEDYCIIIALTFMLSRFKEAIHFSQETMILGMMINIIFLVI